MKKIYFASDFHLGLPNHAESLIREKKIVTWLDQIKTNASDIYLLGDLFDFWHEWKNVVPKGFTRFLGKLAELSDNGIQIHYFTGNHDIWAYNYLTQEIGIKIYRKPETKIINNKKFFLAHGDGLGPGDSGFKLLKKIFTSKFLQWLFARIHPNTAMGFGIRWSQSREGLHRKPISYGDKEWLIQYSKKILEKEHFDFFVFGHRHLPMIIQLQDNSKYINLGDWLVNFTYAEFDGQNIVLNKFE